LKTVFFLLAIALTKTNAHAADMLLNLKISSLECDEISSSGFLSNIIIQHPKLARGMLGNIGISGQSCAQFLLGRIPYDVTIGIDGDIHGPGMFAQIRMSLLTPNSAIRLGAPDAEMICDMQVTN